MNTLPTFLILLLGLLLPSVTQGAEPGLEKKIKVLVVTGGHGFSREPFFRMFTDNPEIVFTEVRHGTNAAQGATAYETPNLLENDVVVLYDMPKSITSPQQARFRALLEKGVGMLVLHHALVSYQHWPEYEKTIGGRYPEADGKSGVVSKEVGYQHDVDLPVVIVGQHPVTAGLKDFVIHDEIYWGFRVGSDVTPLLTTTLAKSGKPLAWVREEGRSRIVSVQMGHGPEAFANQQYRQLLAQSIRWAARRS
jgi:type 1 glutamine amidotransferase